MATQLPPATPPDQDDPADENELGTRDRALADLSSAAAGNIPGADLVSVTLRRGHEALLTIASTGELARVADQLQYELGEGPCYAAVTHERFVLVNDMAAAHEFPRYAPRALALGVGAQAAIQLLHNGESAGLNLYSRKPGAFDRSTIDTAELFATQAGALLGYAGQVEQLSAALHTRTDIGTAVGILMERYDLDRHRAFGFLTRLSQDRNVKVRELAQQVIDGSFSAGGDQQSRDPSDWP